MTKREFPKYWAVKMTCGTPEGLEAGLEKQFIFQFYPNMRSGFLTDNKINDFHDLFIKGHKIMRTTSFFRSGQNYHPNADANGTVFDSLYDAGFYMLDPAYSGGHIHDDFRNLLGCLDLIFNKELVGTLYNAAAYNEVKYPGKNLQIGTTCPQDNLYGANALNGLNVSELGLDTRWNSRKYDPDPDCERNIDDFKYKLEIDKDILAMAKEIDMTNLSSKSKTIQIQLNNGLTNKMTNFIANTPENIVCNIKIASIENAWNNLPFKFRYYWLEQSFAVNISVTPILSK